MEMGERSVSPSRISARSPMSHSARSDVVIDDLDLDEPSEFEQMRQGHLTSGGPGHGFPTWKQRTYATRILKMNLSSLERDTLAFSIRQFKRYGNEGNAWHRRGNFLFAVQMVAAAVVPVLIGLLGSFNSDLVDNIIRIVAILLSITGTFCNVIESVYQFRARGERRKTFADRMSANFENFSSLSAPPFTRYASNDDAESKVDLASVTIPNLSAVPLQLLQSYIRHRLELHARRAEQSCNPAPHSGENFREYCKVFNTLQEECRKSAFVNMALDDGPSTAHRALPHALIRSSGSDALAA